MTFLNPTEEDRLRIFLVAELARHALSRASSQCAGSGGADRR